MINRNSLQYIKCTFNFSSNEFFATERLIETVCLIGTIEDANFKQIILSDFEGPKPPTFCGVDLATGDDKFCCIDLNKAETEIKPQLPQFPVSGTVSTPRPCIDHTSICSQWLQAQYIHQNSGPVRLGYSISQQENFPIWLSDF